MLLALAALGALQLAAAPPTAAADSIPGSPELQAARGAALTNPWASGGGSRRLQLKPPLTAVGEHDVYDVRAFGAKGDATTDDTAAFQAAFDACIEGGGGDVVVPPGAYMMEGTVTVNCTQATPHSLRGAGWSSNLLWASDADLIVWTDPPPITVAELAISSIKSTKSVNSTALRVGVGPAVGAQRCEFDHLMFFGAGTVPNTTYVATHIGTALNLGNESDTTTVRDCIFWFVSGTGIVIGHGSEIRIEGGRIIGSLNNAADHTFPANTTVDQLALNGSIGIHVTGNNGGVHVLSTDVIGHAIGVRYVALCQPDYEAPALDYNRDHRLLCSNLPLLHPISMIVRSALSSCLCVVACSCCAKTPPARGATEKLSSRTQLLTRTMSGC